MVTVEYELARGLRVRHQTATGFSVSASKTIATTLSALYSATASAAKRKQWFPQGELEVSSQTKNKYFRGVVERQRTPGDRFLREGGRQGADRRPGEQAREARARSIASGPRGRRPC